jgi:zinc/manganese transport system permease protein
VIGTLLIFALLVAPGAAAQQLTARPGLAFPLTIALSLVFVWAGLAIAYFSLYPVGFFVTSLAFGTYLGIRIVKAVAARLPARTELGLAA